MPLEWLLALRPAMATPARGQRLEADAGRRAETIDPVWGGASSTPTAGLGHPHFEKIMSRQFADLRGYALAYGAFRRSANLSGGGSRAPLPADVPARPDGAFYASQDADVKQGEHSASTSRATTRAGAGSACR